MKHLTAAGVLFITLAVSVQVISCNYGTCASIGYSASCCPPGNNCQAADGDCYCKADCHIHGDCCIDVYCPAHPRTCGDIGITSCCTDNTGNGRCDVHFRDDQNNRCSCNVTCHQRNDCCTDAGCVPQTCSEAGKDAGCCVWSTTQSCFVPHGRCYCDSLCTKFNDCCTDVLSSVNCERSRVQSDLEQDLNYKASTMLRYNEYNRRSQARIQNSNLNPQYYHGPDGKPPRARAHVQQPRVDAREYRARALHQHGRYN